MVKINKPRFVCKHCWRTLKETSEVKTRILFKKKKWKLKVSFTLGLFAVLWEQGLFNWHLNTRKQRQGRKPKETCYKTAFNRVHLQGKIQQEIHCTEVDTEGKLKYLNVGRINKQTKISFEKSKTLKWL